MIPQIQTIIFKKVDQTMSQFLQEIRTHFNILLEDQSLSLTLINPNITAELFHDINNKITILSNLQKIEYVIIQCPNFDDELLTILSKGLPHSLQELTLDLTGCQSLRGPGFLQLFEKLDNLQIKKLRFDFGSIYDINDIVMEGMTMLLTSSVDLQEFYLDLYEVDQITEEGYLLLAQAISGLSSLTKLHIDLSANYNLNEDSLEILFAGMSKNLTHLTFKILDTEEIGGGSFFKLGQALGNMTNLQELNLTISTFDNLNQKGVYSIIRSIGKLMNLKKLQLNLSNTNLPQKMLGYLTINPSLTELNLDISCNRKITFGDFLNFGLRLKKLKKIEMNLDFCTGISQDTIEEVISAIRAQNKCQSLTLSDRNYSIPFQETIIDDLMNIQPLLQVNIATKTVSKKMIILEKLIEKKNKMIQILRLAKKKNLPMQLNRAIIDHLFYCL